MVALFVIATILLFVVADAVVAYMKRKEAPATEPQRAFASQGMPSGLFVHPNHVWLSVEPSGDVHVGLDELARKLVGAIDSVRFADTGKAIKRGETLFWVKAGDMEVPFASPVSGMVQSTQLPGSGVRGNEAAAWFAAVKPERLGFEIRSLRVAEDAAAWLRAEFRRLSETLQGLRLQTAGALPDGGEPADGLLRVLDAASREELLRGFLARKL
jgi:glycine cleavage system H lipoate-binding protein